MKHSIILLTFIASLCFSPSLLAKRYGLIIGSNYKNNKANIPELKLCEKDARYIERKIKQIGKFDEVKALLGKQVTKSNIKKEIYNLGKMANQNDTVFLYFAGHGFFQRDASAKNGMRNYLVCYDRPHLSDEELNQYLKRIKSPKTLFVFDCCFSGGIAKKGAKTRGDGAIPIPSGSDGTVKQDSDDFYFQNKAIISSADDDQTAIEVGGRINHGIFTYNFGKALESADLNGDRVITALEAFFQTRQAVEQMALRHNHSQTPQVSGNASGIFLAGQRQPTPPPKPVEPPKKTENQPEPESKPAKVDPIVPPITIEEPVAENPAKIGNLLIRTTIIQDRSYGLKNLSPVEMMKRKKSQKGERNVKVLISGNEYPIKLYSVPSKQWGATRKGGRLTPGKIYNIQINKIPAGVHNIVIKADDYPEIQRNFAILPGKTNEMDVFASMSGFGAIQGKVFYKYLDNPIHKQTVYMPTIKGIDNLKKVKTDKQGNFWFTNLIPGSYQLRASFAENLKLHNSDIKVKEGEVTKVQVILNKALLGAKPKYK